MGLATLRQLFSISIHAPRKGERLVHGCKPPRCQLISIHAPRKGERLFMSMLQYASTGISIHAPRKGERREPSVMCGQQQSNFNPRSPQGGATRAADNLSMGGNDFNPRSPQGGATKNPSSCRIPKKFQSTLPARGSDGAPRVDYSMPLYFNPRSPQGGATLRGVLRIGRADTDFNPRSPQGGATLRDG